MKQLIACCGLDCESCDARIATVKNDDELREKTAQKWSAMNKCARNYSRNYKLYGVSCGRSEICVLQ